MDYDVVETYETLPKSRWSRMSRLAYFEPSQSGLEFCDEFYEAVPVKAPDSKIV